MKVEPDEERPMNRPATVERDIFQRRVVGVAEEMSAALRRSAFSSIIWEMYDYSCALFTPDGRMIAQAETIAAQLGVMETACRHIGEEVPIAGWRDGDVVVCNDPYRGCTHTPDIVMFTPVFADGRLVALASTIAHHVEIGGKSPCTTVPDNTEVFGEGLIFPPMKIVREGEENAEVFAMLAANVRVPEASLGYLRAQIAGCRTGERRVRDLVRRYGTESFGNLCEAVLDHGEACLRASIREIGNGTSSATVRIEDGVASDEPIAVACRVTVADDSLEVDFTGTSEQRANGLNCPLASTVSMVSYAVKAVLAPDVVQNGGCTRPIRVRAPEGSVLNPARSGAGTTPSRRWGRRCWGRSPRWCRTSPGAAPRSPSPRSRRAASTAVPRAAPIRVLRTELVPDSGGRGRFRGGLAIRRDYELLCDGVNVNAYVQQVGERTRPRGGDGGEPGGFAQVALNPGTDAETPLPSKAMGLRLDAGAVIRLQSSGSGGLGDPAERSPDQARRDRELGYATR